MSHFPTVTVAAKQVLGIGRRHLTRLVLAIAIALTVTLLLARFTPSFFPTFLSPALVSVKPVVQFKKSSFDWTTVEEHYPAQSLTQLPVATPKKLPRVQYDFANKQTYDNSERTEIRRAAVRDAFIRSWQGYKQHAWLHDELMPVSGGKKDPFAGWAATLVDSLDTMWIMGLKTEFYEAAAAAASIDWSNTTERGINLFETTIRHLGGLLSAHDLSGEPALLKKAQELGDMLYMAFDTPNRMPGFWLTFEDAKAGRQLAGTHDPSAVPTSLSMEFTRLAQLTGKDKYYDAIDRVRAFLQRTQEQSRLPGMWPAMINFQREDVRTDNSFALGALADSLYEYLPKMFILLGGRDGGQEYEKMYRRAMDVAIEHILFRPMLPDGKDILFAGTAFVQDDGINLVPEGQHLHCFLGGMFALAGRTFEIEEHVHIGERLARGCAWAYGAFPTGMMPEYFNLIECKTLQGCPWDPQRWEKEGDKTLTLGFRHARDPRYILRPEAIESLFVLYRITGQEDLRDMAWTMFESIMEGTKTPYANAAIKDVRSKEVPEKEDSMEV
jgi:mannosyl-oligosaccharide alpha-1,2-mannosidase